MIQISRDTFNSFMFSWLHEFFMKGGGLLSRRLRARRCTQSAGSLQLVVLQLLRRSPSRHCPKAQLKQNREQAYRECILTTLSLYRRVSEKRISQVRIVPKLSVTISASGSSRRREQRRHLRNNGAASSGDPVATSRIGNVVVAVTVVGRQTRTFTQTPSLHLLFNVPIFVR